MKLHDIHWHTNLSSCAKRDSSLEVMVRTHKASGVTVLGITNHLWDADVSGASGWYAPQNVEHNLAIHEEFDRLSPELKEGLTFHFGCETEYTGKGHVALTPENAAKFEYVLVPPHHFHMGLVRSPEITETRAVCKLMLERFEECCEIGFAWGLAHPFAVLGFPDREEEIMGALTDNELASAFAMAAEKKKSIEINLACVAKPVFRMTRENLPAQWVRVFTIAREAGCSFHIGSDAHEPSRLAPELFALGAKLAEHCGIRLADDPLKK